MIHRLEKPTGPLKSGIIWNWSESIEWDLNHIANAKWGQGSPSDMHHMHG